MLNNDDEFEIFRLRLQHDDETAFKTFFINSFPSLTRFAYTYLKAKEPAEEIASDVLLNIWQQRQKMNGVRNLKLYLYSSIRNTALNYLKKEKRHDALGLDHAAVWLKADDVTPEQLAISTELYTKISNTITSLPPRCQMIYKLVKEDGLKYREVAELLNLSVKTVEAQMGIALKKLVAAIDTAPVEK